MLEAVRSLVEPVVGALPPNASAVLYGSAVRGGWVAGRSDVNLLVVMEEVGPEALRSLSGALAAWRSADLPPPLVLTRTEWNAAADAFPLEMADMKDAYEVLRGTDPVVGLRVDPRHLRLALEREVRGKLFRLRQGYLGLADDRTALGRLAQSSIGTVLFLVRSALRLAGKPVSPADDDVVRAGAALLGRSPAALTGILAARDVKGWSVPASVFEDYLGDVEHLARWVDHSQPGDHP